MRTLLKSVLCLALTLCLLLPAFGAAALAEGDGITIGYDIYFVGNSWSVQLYKEFEAAVKRAPAGAVKDVIYVESEGAVDKQIANLEALIEKGVDAIITTPNSSTALELVLTKARAAGIKVILLASSVAGDYYDAMLTVNDYDFGAVGAQWLADTMGGKGNVILLNGIAGLSVSDDRRQGALDVFANYPEIKVVAEAYTDWDYAKAKTEASNILAAQPQIDGVYSQGGAVTLATIEVFQAAQRDLVPMTSEDNNGFLKKWRELLDSGVNFQSVALAKPTWLAADALDVALKLCAGESVEKDQILPPPTITNDTLDQFVKPGLSDSFWNNTRMTDEEIREAFPS